LGDAVADRDVEDFPGWTDRRRIRTVERETAAPRIFFPGD
jgi:hypothetical protein